MKRVQRMASVLILGVSLAWAETGLGAEWSGSIGTDPRTSVAGGVRIVVTPKALAPRVPAWEFQLTMETHIRSLSEDPARVVVLVDDKGRRYKPTVWQGDPPGGHHRKGILRFPLPSDKPRSVELHLTGIGGPEERVLRWDVK